MRACRGRTTALAGAPRRRFGPLAPQAAVLRHVFEFFETDKATVKLPFRDATRLGADWKSTSRRNSLSCLHRRHEALLPLNGAEVVEAPLPMRTRWRRWWGSWHTGRLNTDDNVTAAQVADFRKVVGKSRWLRLGVLAVGACRSGRPNSGAKAAKYMVNAGDSRHPPGSRDRDG